MLQVSSAGGKHYSLEETTIGRKHFAIAEPNDEYIVKVMIHRSSSGNFVADNIRVALYLDGIDCKYWKRVDTTKVLESESVTCTTFKGIRINENEMQAFKFSPPNVASGETSINTNEEAGSVRVEIFEAVLDVGMYSNKTNTYQQLQRACVPQDCKFFKCPSVTTTGGRVIESEEFIKVPRWKNMRKLASMEMHYHTKDVVDIIRANHCINRNNRLSGRKRPATIDLTSDKSDEEVEDNNQNDAMRDIDTSEEQEQEGDECVEHVLVTKKIPLCDMSVGKRSKMSFICKEY